MFNIIPVGDERVSSYGFPVLSFYEWFGKTEKKLKKNQCRRTMNEACPGTHEVTGLSFGLKHCGLKTLIFVCFKIVCQKL